MHLGIFLSLRQPTHFPDEPEKKTAIKGPAATLDVHALTRYYEALRKDVVELGGCGHTMMRGRALVMFKGMAAWMKCAVEDRWPRPVPVAPRSGLSLPVGIEQNLVDIVASMAIATALEGIT